MWLLLPSAALALRLGSYGQTDLRSSLNDQSLEMMFRAMDHAHSEPVLLRLLGENHLLFEEAFCQAFRVLDHRQLPPDSIAYTSRCLDTCLKARGRVTKASVSPFHFIFHESHHELLRVLDPVTINSTYSHSDFIYKALCMLIKMLRTGKFLFPCLLRLYASMHALRLDSRDHRVVEIVAKVRSKLKAVDKRFWSKALRGLARQVMVDNPQPSQLVRSLLLDGLEPPAHPLADPIEQADSRRFTLLNRLMALFALATAPHETWLADLTLLLLEAKLIFSADDLSWFLQALPKQRRMEIKASNCVFLFRQIYLPFLGGDRLRHLMLKKRADSYPPIPGPVASGELLNLGLLPSTYPQLHQALQLIFQQPGPFIQGAHEVYARQVLACLRRLTMGHYFQPIRRRPRLALAPLLLREVTAIGHRLEFTPLLIYRLTGSLLRMAFQLGLRLPFHFDGHTKAMAMALHRYRHDLLCLHSRMMKHIHEYDDGQLLSLRERHQLQHFHEIDTGGSIGFGRLLLILRPRRWDRPSEMGRFSLTALVKQRYRDALLALFGDPLFEHESTWQALFS